MDQDLILLREENRQLRRAMGAMRDQHREEALELQRLRHEIVELAASGRVGRGGKLGDRRKGGASGGYGETPTGM